METDRLVGIVHPKIRNAPIHLPLDAPSAPSRKFTLASGRAGQTYQTPIAS